MDAGIDNIYIENGLKVIGELAFFGCRVKSIEIPSSVTTIKYQAFTMSKIESIILSNNLTEIADGLFQSCKYLKSIIINQGVKKIGVSSFRVVLI